MTSDTKTTYSKRLAFEASRNAVEYLLNRKDLLPSEREIIERALTEMEKLNAQSDT